MTASQFAPLLLRIGLAFLFLWFGYQQLMDAASWIDWVPTWATIMTGLTPETIVFANGIFEVIGGAMILVGLFVRPVAIILGIHLCIIAVDIGVFTGIGVRDIALAFATLSLGLSTPDDWTIDSRMV